MAIQSLAWVQDGTTSYESSVAQNLRSASKYAPEAFWALIRHPDIERIDEDTGQLPVGVAYVAGLLPDIHANDDTGMLLSRLMDMPFMESIERNDRLPLYLLYWLLVVLPTNHSEVYRIMSHPSLSDGISDDRPLSLLGLYIGNSAPELAAELEALPWVGDGIDDSEFEATQHLQLLALNSLTVLQAVLAKPWTRDGLSSNERSVVQTMAWMSQKERYSWGGSGFLLPRYETYALRIIQTPFLETVEFDDVLLVWQLELPLKLGWGLEGYQFLDHPELRNGVTDEHASALTALAVLKVGGDRSALGLESLVTVLLDPSKTTVEKRTITLPLAGEVHLRVVKTDSYPHYMNSLADTVRKHEEFMAIPFPDDHALLAVADIGGGGWGGLFGSMAIDTGYALAGLEPVRGVIAHEVGHSYWSTFRGWITEGGAVFLQRMSMGMDTYGFDFRIGVDSCESVANLAELERQIFYLAGTSCNYITGSGVFYDLYYSLGEEAFRQGFTSLYLNLSAEELQGTGLGANEEWHNRIKHDICHGIEGLAWSLCHMKAALVAGSEPDKAAKADTVLQRWFFARPPNRDS